MDAAVNIAQIILAVLGALGAIVAIVAWFYRRGGHERLLTEAIRENTNSNREVSAELKDFKAETLTTLRDYGWRLKILEDKVK